VNQDARRARKGHAPGLGKGRIRRKEENQPLLAPLDTWPQSTRFTHAQLENRGGGCRPSVGWLVQGGGGGVVVVVWWWGVRSVEMVIQYCTENIVERDERRDFRRSGLGKSRLSPPSPNSLFQASLFPTRLRRNNYAS
jgi:hypothetical protein